MMTFYAAAGSYQIRSEDGKNMPYIMRLGKLQPVSIPEFSLWSMLLWDVLTYEELRKKFYDKRSNLPLLISHWRCWLSASSSSRV
jgi:hypothetical protein